MALIFLGVLNRFHPFEFLQVRLPGLHC